MDIFQKASKLKLRFATSKCPMTVEDLWDLPLTSARGVSLDLIAKSVNRGLKEVEEESFVKVASKESSTLQLKLDILKVIIAAKIESKASAQAAVANKAKKEKILEIISKKQDSSLENMTEEDLTKMLEGL